MDINEILNKNKEKKITFRERKPVYVATEDRPYDIDEKKEVLKEENKYKDINELVGLQKRVVIFLCEKASKDRITPPLSYKDIIHITDFCSAQTLKITLLRLIKKEIIKKYKFKTGRNGWSQYQISEDVFKFFERDSA